MKKFLKMLTLLLVAGVGSLGFAACNTINATDNGNDDGNPDDAVFQPVNPDPDDEQEEKQKEPNTDPEQKEEEKNPDPEQKEPEPVAANLFAELLMHDTMVWQSNEETSLTITFTATSATTGTCVFSGLGLTGTYTLTDDTLTITPDSDLLAHENFSAYDYDYILTYTKHPTNTAQTLVTNEKGLCAYTGVYTFNFKAFSVQ